MVVACKTSGLSQADYCRQRGLTQNDLSWWKREIIRRDAISARSAPAFIPVRMPAPQTPGYPFELTLRGGRLMRFAAGIDAAALGVIVRELERDAC
jgi:hypothetical protein